MWLELQLIEQIGIEPKEALKMATVNNAKLLKMENKIGSVEKGLYADLAIFEKNPLESATNISHPLYVIKNGELVYDSQKV